MPLRQAPIRPVAGWRFRAERPDAQALAWLLDPGSLTARLVSLAGRDFRVRITGLGWQRPTRMEARELGMPLHERALVREVVLEGFGEPWVLARSVIPRRSLAGRNRQLRRLGNRPLGAFLFRDPTLQRRAVRFTRLAAGAGVGSLGSASTHTCWGRRSTFILRGQPLIVAEFFLPALLHQGRRETNGDARPRP
jgi:chorismate--pyruvate lyase